MKNFRRSLKYLWPYRRRLALSVLCAVLIGVLWGGGLGALLPGLKIMISDEGLHGWAWNSATEDMLEIRLVQQTVPARMRIDGLAVGKVLNVVKVTKDGRAQTAGIKSADWIIGLEDGAPDHRILRADELVGVLAELGPDRQLRLRIYDPTADSVRTIVVVSGRLKFSSRLLTRAASMFRVPETRAERFPLLAWLLLLTAGITLARNLLRFLHEYLVGSAIFRGIMDIRCDTYDSVLRLPTTFFSEKGVSDSMSRFVTDASQLGRGQIILFGKMVVEPAKMIASVAMALYFSWQLTLLVMVAGPPAFIVIHKLGKRMRRASKRALESAAAMLAVLAETLNGVRVVKAYTMEAAERKRFFRVSRGLLTQEKRILWIDAATAPVIEAVGMVAAIGAIAVAGYWVFTKPEAMDKERFLALMACMVAMFDPVRKLSKVVARFQRSEAAAARIFELRDEPQEKHVPNAPMLPRHSESIEFEGVTFRYPSAADDALRDITLRIPAGEALAIVGPNGCGKTTLASMLPRLLDPAAGRIRIDGRDIREYSVRSLRRQIALVTQDAVIFNATIGDNIAYGKRRSKREQIESAARKAFVDEFVRDLPDGYDTMVGERGATLSGGQRQRIAIARAILRDPAILIFDEAMSQVDPESERKIHQALAGFMEGRTALIIAHRLATVLEAERIAVMDDGRIVDTGTHAELLERCGLYQQLYRTQFAPGQ